LLHTSRTDCYLSLDQIERILSFGESPQSCIWKKEVTRLCLGIQWSIGCIVTNGNYAADGSLNLQCEITYHFRLVSNELHTGYTRPFRRWKWTSPWIPWI
jgi:hypothetical protein